MAAQSISAMQRQAINNGALDLMGEDKSGSTVVKLNTIVDSLDYIGAKYKDKLNKQLIAKDLDSSGKLADSTQASEVQKNGSVYSISITANVYASYLDEGVNGWANPRGSKFSFKTKGVNPDGEMVKSIKAYLSREKKIAAIKNRPVSSRERKRSIIKDATTERAISAAYMIKRQGIKPTHFWRDATAEMTKLIEEEFAAALKIDIINSLTGEKY